MKLISILAVLSVFVWSAAEHPRGKLIQLCGAELARAVKLVCQDGDLDFLNLQHVQKHHHEHNHEGFEWKGHAMKREAVYTLSDECCAKPCHVKDFATYCP